MSSGISIPISYIALKTIVKLGKAYNHDITRAILRLKKEGIALKDINFYYSPEGPCSQEVGSALSGLHALDEIDVLSPARATPKGTKHLNALEKSLNLDQQTLTKIVELI